jgi:hypothetical protein
LKAKKVRVSAVIEPWQRQYIDDQIDLPSRTFGEVIRELLAEAIEARQAKEAKA